MKFLKSLITPCCCGLAIALLWSPIPGFVDGVAHASSHHYYRCSRGYVMQIRNNGTEARCYRRGKRERRPARCSAAFGGTSGLKIDHTGFKDVCIKGRNTGSPTCTRGNLRTGKGADYCSVNTTQDVKPPNRMSN